MTALILRPDPRHKTRRHVSFVDEYGTEVALGHVTFLETHWGTHKGERARTREDAIRKLAEGAGLAGPFHTEELAARVRTRRAVLCPRGRLRGTVVTVRLVRA